MRLLNVKTLKLEWFHNADVAPSYAILSHRWEDEEVLFEDVVDKAGAQELRSLQEKLEETERQLQNLFRRFDGQAQTAGPPNAIEHPPVSSNVKVSIPISSGESESDKFEPRSVVHVHTSQKIKPTGWSKVLGCCKIAKQFGISYVWIDTCCIDTSSSSELSESLNSMFAWYQCATLFVAYLSDVTQNWELDSEEPNARRPQHSAWFTRGWTLQELLAPNDVLFYRGDWTFLGIRSELVDEIHEITGIEKAILERNGLEKLHSLSVAARMSWAADRVTTRPEDRAYSLLGIFGVNMPILYGEGEKNAFFRLQVMIFQTFSDHSIFAWKALYLPWDTHLKLLRSKDEEINLFAPSPLCFKGLGYIECMRPEDLRIRRFFKPMSPHSMCVQLWMRPLGQEDTLFREDEPRFETLFGIFGPREIMRRAVVVVLARTGLGRYRRLVPDLKDDTDDEARDLRVIKFNNAFQDALNAFSPLTGWSVNDVLISNPRPTLPSKACEGRYYVPIALNCTTVLKAGVEVGGFWGEKPGDVKIEDESGERIYIALLQLLQEGDHLGRSIAFTVRNTRSGEIYGLILAMKDWKTFNVSIVYDLAEEDFTERDFFDSLLKRHKKLESQNLLEDVLSYKLNDGSHLFLSCDDQDILSGRSSREYVQVALGDIDLEKTDHKEVRDILTRGTKAQLRVGIIQ